MPEHQQPAPTQNATNSDPHGAPASEVEEKLLIHDFVTTNVYKFTELKQWLDSNAKHGRGKWKMEVNSKTPPS